MDKVKNIINHIIDSMQEISEQDAWWILEFITKKTRATILASQDLELNSEQKKMLDSIIHEHNINKKPLQYIFGTVPFGDITIKVEPPILIPRPETEAWCYELISQIKKLDKNQFNFLDLCTGSGCIGIALAKAFEKSNIHATDLSEKACKLAKENAILNNVNNISIYKSDLFENISKNIKFDLIVSNPPYISRSQWEELDPSVKNWEDFYALVADDSGLEIIEKIIKQAKEYLQPRDDFETADIPQIAIEIDYTHGDIVKNFMEQNGYKKVKILKDYFGNNRLAIGNI